jgi:predicted ATPase
VEHAEQELQLHVSLGSALRATRGLGAPEVAQAYTRARELCQRVGETPQLFPVLRGLWGFYFVRDLQTAYELGQQLLTLAQRLQDPTLLLHAHATLGTTLGLMGEYIAAQAHLEHGMALYDPQRHRSHAFLSEVDPGVACRGGMALDLWYLGYPDQARQWTREALALAQELAHPYSLAFALSFAARFHRLCWERRLTREQAEIAITLATEYGFAQPLTQATILRGWALAEEGEGVAGMEEMRRSLAALEATGGPGRPFYLSCLVEAYGRVGRVREGLAILTEALAVVENTGARNYEAELHRLRGELLLQQDAASSVEAEGCFRQALDLARRQQAKSLELRAAMSLSRLWQQQGKRAEAYEVLTPIYGWFTEGLDTVDLQEAKALLETLL